MSYLSSPSWAGLADIVSESLSDSARFAETYHTDRIHAEKAIRTFTGLKDFAALGSKAARQNIVDYYIRLMESYDRDKLDGLLNGAVNFREINQNEAEIIFELLLANFSFEEILRTYREYSNNISVMEEPFLRYTALELQRRTGFLKRYEKKREQLNFVCILLYAVSYGQSCIESLQYMDINEIGILNKDYIYIIWKGLKIRLKFLCFENPGTIVNIQKKTTQRSALNYDMQNPIVVTSKNNSNRISAAGYEVTPGDGDFYYNERIFNLHVVSLEDLAEKYQTIDQNMISFLKYNQKGRGSFIVSGSDMGVGKSTFLLSMLGEYPDYWGIGILDQQNELQAGIKYPDKNVITLVENTKRDLAQSFAYLLKTSRDILVVSEITLPDEVSELINAALRLNAGVSATMHSFSPKEVIPNLRNLMMKTPMYQDKNTAEEDIAGCIDLIIHLSRLDTGRIVVDRIHEVCSDLSWKESILYNLGMSENDCDLKESERLRTLLMRLGVRYIGSLLAGRSYYLKPIFRFNKTLGESGAWELLEAPSDQYFQKMSRYAGDQATEQIWKLFQSGG